MTSLISSTAKDSEWLKRFQGQLLTIHDLHARKRGNWHKRDHLVLNVLGVIFPLLRESEAIELEGVYIIRLRRMTFWTIGGVYKRDWMPTSSSVMLPLSCFLQEWRSLWESKVFYEVVLGRKKWINPKKRDVVKLTCLSGQSDHILLLFRGDGSKVAHCMFDDMRKWSEISTETIYNKSM